MKLLIIGHAQHGKDTLADYLRDRYGFQVADSSRRAARIFLFEALRGKYGYANIEECYLDRVNHRAEWYDMICQYNTPDKSRLARDILKDSDVYVGMRDRAEIEACRSAKLFDLIFWVDASARMPLEPEDSFNIDQSLADHVFDNNGHPDRLRHQVDKWLRTIWAWDRWDWGGSC
jgi:hypothetical protein